MDSESSTGDASEADIEEIRFQIAMKALKTSKTDTEKFCALLIIAKFLKPNKLRDDQIYLIFKEMGWKFLYRLLLTDASCASIPEGCKATIFQSISINILTCLFLTNLHLLEESACIKIFTRFANILNAQSASIGEQEDRELIWDILHCCETFATGSYGNMTIVCIFSKSSLTKCLTQIAVSDSEVGDRCAQILENVAAREWAKYDFDLFNECMQAIASEFKTNNDRRKFDLCRRMPNILLNNAPFIRLGDKDVEIWVTTAAEAIFDLLRSRLNDELRSPVFILSSALTECFDGLNWVLVFQNNKQNEDGNRLFLLLSRLVCVEINIELETFKMDYALLSSCFILMENVITAVANDEQQEKCLKGFTSDELIQLLSAIRETMLCIIHFLQMMHFQWEDASKDKDKFVTVLGCIRLLCYWSTEETEALRNEIREVMPFILQVLCEDMKKGAESLMSAGEVVIPSLHSLCVNDSEIKEIVNSSDIMKEIDAFVASNKDNEEMENICRCLKSLCD